MMATTLLKKHGSMLVIGTLASTLSAHQLPNATADLMLRDLSGTNRSLSDYRGKIVVLNFWATWCIPCREEMPLLVSTYKRYEAQGVVMIGASADDETTQHQIAPFIQKLKITFPIWTGATTTHMERLGLGTGLPVTAFIDRDGQIVGRILGILDKKDLQHRLEYLLGDRQGPAPVPLVDQITEARKHPKGDKHDEGEETHTHGGVGVEGASTVPS
jgi:thiol-disulfide isomerase/thioredoxin